MAMEDEYDPFDVGGRDYVPDTPGYQPSKGTAASTLGYTSDQVYGGGGGDGDENNQFIARPGAGLTKPQFEKTYGITDRNPFGRRSSGFANFLDKFSKAIGGRGVDYSQQFRDLDRLHNRRPGRSQELFRQRQYDLYRKPDIAADGRITSGGIDRAGRGTYQGPVEMVTRQMGPGENLIRTGIGTIPFAGSYLSGLGTEEPYLASKVTDEMRARENPSVAEQLIGGLGLGDTIESVRSSLTDRLQGIFTGQGQPSAQDVIPSGPAMGSMDPSREIGPLAQTIPVGLTNQDEVAAMAMLPAEMIRADGMPAESDSRLSDNTTAEKLRESRVVNVPTPIGRRFDLPVTEIDTVSGPLDRYTIDTQTGRPMDEIDTVTSRPMDEIDTVTSRPMDEIDTISFQSLFPSEELDSIAAKPPELVNAPNEGLGRQGGLRFFAPEPELGPYEQSQAPTRDLRDSTAVAELDVPSIADLLNSGLLQDLLTEQGPRTSIPLGEGTLNFRVNPNNPGIEFRRPLQGKDMGVGELLSFLSRRT